MVLSLSIYSLIAVEFFFEFGVQNGTELGYDSGGGEDAALAVPCAYKNIEGSLVLSQSSRELCYGNEYYGTFTRAWFTLFQVLPTATPTPCTPRVLPRVLMASPTCTPPPGPHGRVVV